MTLRDSGTRGMGFITGSVSTADQTINAAITAKLIDSDLICSPGHFSAGAVLRWEMLLSKTAAGTASNAFLVKLGSLGTVADPTILTFSLPVGTAAIDTGWIEITVIVRGPVRTGSCIFQGGLVLTHSLNTTGLATAPSVVQRVLSGVVNTTAENLIVSLACTTAALTVLTFHQVIASSDSL